MVNYLHLQVKEGLLHGLYWNLQKQSPESVNTPGRSHWRSFQTNKVKLLFHKRKGPVNACKFGRLTSVALRFTVKLVFFFIAQALR